MLFQKKKKEITNSQKLGFPLDEVAGLSYKIRNAMVLQPKISKKVFSQLDLINRVLPFLSILSILNNWQNIRSLTSRFGQQNAAFYTH